MKVMAKAEFLINSICENPVNLSWSFSGARLATCENALTVICHSAMFALT